MLTFEGNLRIIRLMGRTRRSYRTIKVWLFHVKSVNHICSFHKHKAKQSFIIRYDLTRGRSYVKSITTKGLQIANTQQTSQNMLGYGGKDVFLVTHFWEGSLELSSSRLCCISIFSIASMKLDKFCRVCKSSEFASS